MIWAAIIAVGAFLALLLIMLGLLQNAKSEFRGTCPPIPARRDFTLLTERDAHVQLVKPVYDWAVEVPELVGAEKDGVA